MFISALEQYWNFNTFRDGQLEAIEALASGRDTFVMFPTGGGKSLCYQVPAVVLDGCCLVVSPLIALMKDQVDALLGKGIPAGFIHSGLSRQQVVNEMECLISGSYKLLYVAPERLQSQEFKGYLRNAKISFLAVDEAHCISQWGFDFRPGYRNIRIIREIHPNIPVMALTASATPRVKADIIASLGLRKPFEIQKSFARPNLSYRVDYKENKIGAMIGELQKSSGTALIYVRNRRLTLQIAEQVRQAGFTCQAYHAGMSHLERINIQKGWMDGEYRVVVATNAFGMGIDKSNVRLVMHYMIPDSLESYYQEAGRAGRDGKESSCVLFYREEDAQVSRKGVNAQYPGVAFINMMYESLANYLQIPVGSGEGVTYEFELNAFAQRYSYPAIQVFHALNNLEKLGYIKMSEAVHIPSRVFFKLSGTELYAFQVRYFYYDALLKALLRSYGGIMTAPVRIQENKIAELIGVPKAEVVHSLKQLDDIGVLNYTPSTDKPTITFLRSRPQEISDPERLLEFNRERNLERMEKLIAYAEAEQCRMQNICSYFGEELEQSCGTCDICMLRKRIEAGGGNFGTVAQRLENLLKQGPVAFSELAERLEASPDMTREVIRWYEAEGKVRFGKDQIIYWN
ncbi:MAG: RecQ family ATP-dependent DNA helicase [Flavobacteriales bacterium]|nr:RecQ family ATP-dependent DNA helicase [Flavobacteriales bacterium]